MAYFKKDEELFSDDSLRSFSIREVIAIGR